MSVTLTAARNSRAEHAQPHAATDALRAPLSVRVRPEHEYMKAQEPDVVDRSLARLHGAASEFAVAVNEAVARQSDGIHPYPLAGAALHRLGADTVAFHEAVLALCATGWVACSAPLLRTLLDLLLSTAIITERADEADMRGFRCTHYFLKAMLSEGDAEAQRSNRQQIEAGLARLAGDDRERARRFIFNDRLPPYWYAPDYYHRPQEAADALLVRELASYYAKLSSAAHGGFFGLGLLRDQPDTIHPNQRSDPHSQALALLTSTRILLEQVRARDQFESGGRFQKVYEELLARLVETGQTWHPSQRGWHRPA